MIWLDEKTLLIGHGFRTNAARVAMGMEAYVTVIDKSLPRLYELDLQFGSQLHTLFATMENIEREVLAADLVVADLVELLRQECRDRAGPVLGQV